MQYQVLARKWRPQNFHEIVGQEHVSRTLLNALQSGRVAHAFLFSGPRGSGKTTTARILAKALNCHAGKPGEPCGGCVACTEITAGNCLDVQEIDAASNTGVDNVRDLIEQVQYFPARDRHKVFIIDEVHMLSTSAFNALLKTLEEPPPHVVFIMATTEYHKIPATIHSRCQKYSFKLIKFPLILDRLTAIAREEGIQISKTALEQVAFSSGGSMRDAMSALDQVIAFSGNTVRDADVPMLLGLIEPSVLGNTVRAIAGKDIPSLLQITAELADAGQDLENFCRRLLGQFRNLLVLKSGVSDPSVLGVPESLVADLRSQSELFSREDLLRLFEAFFRIEDDLKHATQKRFQLEMGLIELAHVSRMRALEDLIADFQRMFESDAPAASTARSAPVAAPQLPQRVDPAPRAGRPSGSLSPAAAPSPASGSQVAEYSPPPAEEVRQEPDIPAQAQGGDGPRDLLLRIASAVHKESLESLMQSLGGAEQRGAQVILDPGSSTEFVRRRIRENLTLIEQAALQVLGQPVKVTLGAVAGAVKTATPTPKPEPGPNVTTDPLERAKREPVVRSFLDVFPGPVKVEDLEK